MGPLSTCKLFGAVRAVTGIKNAVPVIHGPRGCAYHISYLLTARGAKRVRIASTELLEEDVVFGASEKLLNTIKSVDRAYEPDLIVVMSSCSTSIIGEDIKRAANEAETELKARVMSVSAGGFESNQSDGYMEVMTTLIEKFCRPRRASREPSLNIIGEFRGGPDLKRLKENLNAMGVTVNCVLTAGSSLPEIMRIPEAGLNYSFCDASGIEPCRVLEEKFGIPFFHHPPPLGFTNSLIFYRNILDYFSIDYPLEEVFSHIQEKISELKLELEGRRAAVVAGPTRAVALVGLLNDLGMETVMVSMDMIGDYTLENLAQTSRFKSNVLISPDNLDLEETLMETDPEIIIGGLAETPLAEALRVPLIDVMHGCQLTTGFEGSLNVSMKIKSAIENFGSD